MKGDLYFASENEALKNKKIWDKKKIKTMIIFEESNPIVQLDIEGREEKLAWILRIGFKTNCE